MRLPKANLTGQEKMNKQLSKAFVLTSILIFAGCAGTGEIKKVVEQPTQSVSDAVNISEKVREDVGNATKKENENINNALNENDMTNEDLTKKYSEAVLKTNLGDVKVKFDANSAPNTVNNFLKLTQSKFYDGTKFHRVIKGFMIQGGDPFSKDESMKEMWGTGGPGYKFNDELRGTEKYPQGTLAMANSGPNTNGSQFFIVTASPESQLPPSYTVFGEVVSGMDTVLKIENVKTGANDRPVEDVVLNSVELLEK